MSIHSDQRVVMTLDAGGTNFVFSAIQGGVPIIEPIHFPSNADNLERCLDTLTNGFHAVRSKVHQTPVAISFAFPGPCDYPRGIVGELPNLPAFRGGVALGPMLEAEFEIPVFMNNDGDLFAYGEAIGGFLPWVNENLEKSGSAKRFKNLVGVTLGTGFGAGIVIDGRLLIGDNSSGSEVWVLSGRYNSALGAEESISIRAVRRHYAALAGIRFEQAPTPKDIYEIATEKIEGNKSAALESFRLLGQALGGALANLLTLTDGVAVIGGGLSGARELFVPAMLVEMRSSYTNALTNIQYPRLAQQLFYLNDKDQMTAFCKGAGREITIPGSDKTMVYDPMARLGVGFSTGDASTSIALGAYAYAINNLG
ncbi:MAG: ROK family protein [Mucinivorans sp.]